MEHFYCRTITTEMLLYLTLWLYNSGSTVYDALVPTMRFNPGRRSRRRQIESSTSVLSPFSRREAHCQLSDDLLAFPVLCFSLAIEYTATNNEWSLICSQSQQWSTFSHSANNPCTFPRLSVCALATGASSSFHGKSLAIASHLVWHDHYQHHYLWSSTWIQLLPCSQFAHICNLHRTDI